MCALAAYIGDREYDMGRQFFLDVQVPLLHVRPQSLVGNRKRRKREDRHGTSATADACVTAAGSTCGAGARLDEGLCGVQNKRGRAFQRFGAAFVAVGVFVENTVAAANGHLAIALGIKREPDARGGGEEMSLQATGLRTGS